MKQRGREVRAAGGLEGKIRALEKQYNQIAGLLITADQQDHHMRKAAGAMHDHANELIAELQAKITAGEATESDLKDYGRLLKERKQLAAVQLSDRKRHWERGHEPPI